MVILNSFNVGLLVYYLFLNIESINGNGVGIFYLILFFMISFFVMSYYIGKETLYLKVSFFVLLVVFYWFSVSVFGHLNDTSILKELTIGTTGGVFLFYLIGLCLSVSFNAVFKIGVEEKYIVFYILTLLLLFILAANAVILLNFKSNLRGDLYLLKGTTLYYQRPGDFLTILFLIASYGFFLFKSICCFFTRPISLMLRALVDLVYFTIFVITVFNAQVIGSNNSFLVSIMIFLITLVTAGVLSDKSLINSYMKYDVLKVYSKKSLVLLFKKLSVYVFLAGASLPVILNITGFDYTKIRFFQNGLSANSSISSRIELISDNFLVQFSDSPVFGNYNIDVETTGEGSYVHSFLLFSLTHLGFIGFLLLVVFFVLMFCSFNSRASNLFARNTLPIEMPIRLFSVNILICIFLIANLAVTFSWAVIWFSIGLLGSLVVFKK